MNSPHPIRLLGVLAALAAVALLAGCGGGLSSTEPGEPPSGEGPTKDGYIAEADGICQANRSETVPLKEEIETIESAAEPESKENLARLGAILRQANRIAAAEYAELHELEMPAEDEATLDAMYGKAEEGSSLSAEGAEALEAGDLAKFGDIEQRAAKVNESAQAAAKRYGFAVCGKER